MNAKKHKFCECTASSPDDYEHTATCPLRKNTTRLDLHKVIREIEVEAFDPSKPHTERLFAIQKIITQLTSIDGRYISRITGK